MGFRLNLKWGLSVQPHFSSSTNSSSSWPSSSYSSYKGREIFYDSAKVFLSSVVYGETETVCGDPLRARALSSASGLLETNYVGEEVQVDIGNGSPHVSYCLIDDEGEKSFLSSSRAKRSSRFGQLMKNLDVLEEKLTDSDALRMKSEILVQLEKLGALKLFHESLSRTIEKELVDLNELMTDISQDMKKSGPIGGAKSKVFVSSMRKERQQSRRNRDSKKGIDLSMPDPQELKFSSGKSRSKAKDHRWRVSRNEAEMSRGVKLLAELERIRTVVEEEGGQVVSLSRWAEAAGVENKELQKRLHFGWYCRDQLLKSTRSLVVYIARNYRGLGVAFEDLIQAGNIGVLQGAERFDHTRGYKFSTYVHYWIRKSMSMLVARHARGIRVPTTLSNAINKIHRARKALRSSHGKVPNDSELARFTGLSIATITSASKCFRVVGSVDQEIGDSIGARFLEFTADETIMCPKETVTRQHMKNDIYDLLQDLEPREREVLILRFGIGNHQCRSLEEIGRLFCVSKEWIRKIERKALNKLRNEDSLFSLKHYLYT